VQEFEIASLGAWEGLRDPRRSKDLLVVSGHLYTWLVTAESPLYRTSQSDAYQSQQRGKRDGSRMSASKTRPMNGMEVRPKISTSR
jgi:IS30 family transposase